MRGVKYVEVEEGRRVGLEILTGVTCFQDKVPQIRLLQKRQISIGQEREKSPLWLEEEETPAEEIHT